MSASILTVDDSASIRMTIKLALGDAGYSVAEAENGAAGMNGECRQFRSIITDLNMPVMMAHHDRGARKLPAHAGVPIIFLTTESDEGMAARRPPVRPDGYQALQPRTARSYREEGAWPMKHGPD